MFGLSYVYMKDLDLADFSEIQIWWISHEIWWYVLNDEIKSYILSSLYLQFIDTLGSKYMLMVQVTIQ